MKSIGLLLIISLFIKLVLAAAIPLSADEAYYWVWSHSLSLSYFDHPPFVAWLYWLGQPLENFFSAVRWPGVFLGHIALIIWVSILKPYLGEKALFWFVLLALFSPFTGPGSLIITPDTPMLLFWSVLVWGMLRAKDSPNLGWSLFLGFVLGLGFLSKYTIVLFFPILIAVFVAAKWPIKKLALGLTLGALGFALGSWPVWLWNLNNDWISIHFQVDHGLGAKVWKPSWTYEYILAQIGLIFPTVFYFAVKNKKAPFWLYLLAWFPVVFFLITSFRGYAEANWPIMAYLPIIALATWGSSRFVWAKWTAGIWAICLALVLSLVFSIWSPVETKKIKLKELFINPQVLSFAKNQPEVYARTYQLASKLSFELKRPVFKLRGMNRFDFYDLKPQSLPESDSFWLLALSSDKVPEEVLKTYQRKEIVVLDDGYHAWRFVRK